MCLDIPHYFINKNMQWIFTLNLQIIQISFQKTAKTIMHDKIMLIFNEAKQILYFHFSGLLVHYSGSHLDYFNKLKKKRVNK